MKRILCALMGLLPAVCAFAEPATMGLRLGDRPTVQREKIERPGEPNFLIMAGSGVSIFNGTQAPGIWLTAGWRLVDQTFVGLDLGTTFWKPYLGHGGHERMEEATSYQFLPSLWMTGKLTGSLSGRLGFSAGPALVRYQSGARTVRSSAQSPSTTPVTSHSVNQWKMAVLLRPGLSVAVNRQVSLDLEPRFGLFDLDFVVLPLAFLSVSL